MGFCLGVHSRHPYPTSQHMRRERSETGEATVAARAAEGAVAQRQRAGWLAGGLARPRSDTLSAALAGVCHRHAASPAPDAPPSDCVGRPIYGGRRHVPLNGCITCRRRGPDPASQRPVQQGTRNKGAAGRWLAGWLLTAQRVPSTCVACCSAGRRWPPLSRRARRPHPGCPRVPPAYLPARPA